MLEMQKAEVRVMNVRPSEQPVKCGRKRIKSTLGNDKQKRNKKRKNLGNIIQKRRATSAYNSNVLA